MNGLENQLQNDSHGDQALPTAEPVMITDWTGPDDPENPQNWSRGKKAYNISVPAMFAFMVTFMSSIYSLGVVEVAERFNTSTTESLLGISLFCLGLAFGPMFGAPLSETHGRRIVYMASFPISILFILGAGVSSNMASLAICRFFAGFFGSPALSVGGGTNADMYPPAERGLSSIAFLLAPFAGPAFGPIIGGFVAERKGWRWLEYVLIFFSLAAYLYALGIKETYKPAILRRRAKKLGFTTPKKEGADIWAALKVWVTRSLFLPVRFLFTEPIVTFLSIYVAFNFGVLFCFIAAFPHIFASVYGFTLGQVGLTFLSILIGCLLGAVSCYVLDLLKYQKIVREHLKEKKGPVPLEHRLYAAIWGSFGLPIGLFWFAWTAREDVHWASPVVAAIPFAWGNYNVFLASILYLNDCYGAAYGASALSANGILRYLFATASPLFALQLYAGLGIDWATSLLGFISVALLPIPWLLFWYGAAIRKRSPYAAKP